MDIAYDYVSLTDVYLLIPYTQNTLRDMCDFGSQHVSLQIEIPGGPLWTT